MVIMKTRFDRKKQAITSNTWQKGLTNKWIICSSYSKDAISTV